MSGATTGTPLALLPVRLETRFVGTEMLIRVYPDAIHLDTHEPELTEQEVISSRAYWERVWNSHGDSALESEAWRDLAGRHGPARAAWIARTLRPSFEAATTPLPAGDDDSSGPLPRFPQPALRQATWTRAPLARALPDQWYAVGALWNTEGDARDEPPNGPPTDVAYAAGTPIPRVLAAGPDPGNVRGFPAWMTDFTEAEKVGMGLRMQLSTAMQAKGLHRLLVYGLYADGSPEQGARELAELLDAHFYTDGFDLLSIGTPTNNTETVRSAHGRADPADIDGYRVARADVVPAQGSVAAITAKALGIRLEDRPGTPLAGGRRGVDTHVAQTAYARWVLRGTSGHDLDDWLLAEQEWRGGRIRSIGSVRGAADTREEVTRAMHSGLFAGTLGYYLSQMLAPSQIADARRLDKRNVIAEHAYLRHLERARAAVADYVAAERHVLGVDRADALFTSRQASWIAQQAKLNREVRLHTRGEPEAQDIEKAYRDLDEALRTRAEQNWRDRGAPTGNAVDDWLDAERQLPYERTASFAYFTWRERVEQGGAYWGRDREDWTVGEAAALYSEEVVKAARRHFVEFVRPLGPMPAIRVGAQPYGILPIMPLDHWTPAPDEEGFRPFVHALLTLRDSVWLPAAARMPQVGAHRRVSVKEAQDVLLRLLATSPLNQSIFAREHLGRDYVANLWRFARMQLKPDWERILRRTSASVLRSAGIVWTPRLSDLMAGRHSARLRNPLVAGSDINVAEYLTWLGSPDRRWEDLRARTEVSGDSSNTPLLYRLLRHSALREIVTAAVRVQLRRGTLGDWEHLDAELVDLGWFPTATPPRQLQRMITVAGTDVSLEAYVTGALAAEDPDVEVGAFRAAVLTLATSPSDDFEPILRASLDSLSHRLDAWLTSFATKRLRALRAERSEGLVLGGYGWVEHLVPRRGKPASDGFIHAPSVQQAITAGILRSGYLSHTSDERNPFAVNLSSARIRLVQHLLAGVRNGQTLSALAGYMFERELHEAGVDEYTDDFRALAPMSTTVVEVNDRNPDAPTGRDDVQPPIIVDGLKLRAMWQDNDAKLEELLQLVPAGSRALVDKALTLLNEALDATADAVIAESVHHAASGNPSRAAATLDAMARGDGPVPQLDFIRTPRSGISLINRVALLAPATDPSARDWGEGPASALRRTASPALHTISAVLLPAPRRVRCTVSFVDRQRSGSAMVRLSDCDLGPLDVVFLPFSSTSCDSRTAPAFLELAVRDAAARRFHLSADATVSISWERQAHWADDELTFFEMTASAQLIRALLRNGRALRGSDVRPPDDASAAPEATASDVTMRADAVVAVLRSAVAQLGEPALAALGLRQAATLGAVGAAEALLLAGSPPPEVVAAVRSELMQRLVTLSEADSGSGGDLTERSARRIQAVLGSEFLPTGWLALEDTSHLPEALHHGDTLVNGTPRLRRHWLQRVSRVRPAVAALERVRLAGHAVGLIDPLQPRVVQLPGVANEPWVGHKADVSGPRLNLVLLVPDDFDASLPLAGVMIDEWIEVVPRDRQTTGVAFHVDSPAAQAPQAILLAVAPDSAKAEWSPTMIEDAIVDALRVAKVRTVDPEALEDVGQLLPALYLAHNVAGDTASTDVLPE